MKYKIITLNDEDFSLLPYERVATSVGVTDRLLGVSYIRDTGDVDFDVDTLLHEIEEMETNKFAGDWTHEDKYGVRYRNFFRAITNPFKEIGGYLEKTFLPEGVKSTLQKTPILGDIMSRGWLGPTIQQFTNEGREAEAKDTGTAKMVNRATGAAILTAGLGGLMSPAGIGGVHLPGFGQGGMFAGGAQGTGTALNAAQKAGQSQSSGLFGNIGTGIKNIGTGAKNILDKFNPFSAPANTNVVGSSTLYGGQAPTGLGSSTLYGGAAPSSGFTIAGASPSVSAGINAASGVGNVASTPSWWQTGAGKLGIGAATTLAGQFLGPKTPEIPESRFAQMMEQGGLQPRTAIGQQAMQKASELLAQSPQGLSEEYKNAIMADFDKQDAEEERVLKQNYKSLRPYADIENDSAYNKDLTDLKQEQAEYRKNTLAKLEQANEESNKSFQRQDILNALGIDAQTFNEYASLANNDLNTIMLKTGIDYQEAKDFKNLFGKLGAKFISSGAKLNFNDSFSDFVTANGGIIN